VNRDDGAAAIGVLKKVVTTFGSHDLETRTSKSGYYSFAGNARRLCHWATLTF
jgi:hypothetical protein